MGWDPDQHFLRPRRRLRGVQRRRARREAQPSGTSASTRWRDGDADRRRSGTPRGRAGRCPALREALPNIDWGKDKLATRARRPEGDGGVQPTTSRRWSAAPRTSTRVDEDRVPAAATSATRAPSRGRNVFFGVREHGMGGTVNGLAAHGGIVRPYGSTFLQFADYMRGSIRLSALTGLQVAWVFTHDSVGLGEDGPTHQPVEHLAALRAIPELVVLRPGDANETARRGASILEDLEGPAVLVLSRQDLPVQAERVGRGRRPKGAYVLREAEGDEARRSSRPAPRSGWRWPPRSSWRPRARHARRLDAVVGAVRAAGRRVPRGGPAARPAERLGRGRHRDGLVASTSTPRCAIDRFGASAPGGEVLEKLGITPDHVGEQGPRAARGHGLAPRGSPLRVTLTLCGRRTPVAAARIARRGRCALVAFGEGGGEPPAARAGSSAMTKATCARSTGVTARRGVAASEARPTASLLNGALWGLSLEWR